MTNRISPPVCEKRTPQLLDQLDLTEKLAVTTISLVETLIGRLCGVMSSTPEQSEQDMLRPTPAPALAPALAPLAQRLCSYNDKFKDANRELQRILDSLEI